MRQGGGKAKGAQFEREVCRDLSLWISKGRYEDVFWRSAMSGGRATLKGKRAKAQAGDISAIRPIGVGLVGRFMVECKFYRDLKLGKLAGLSSATGIVAFWEKLRLDANKFNKRPMLIAKENRMDTIVVLEHTGMKLLGMETSYFAHFPYASAYLFWFKTFLSSAKC